jgi:hypothetical protein
LEWGINKREEEKVILDLARLGLANQIWVLGIFDRLSRKTPLLIY